MLPESRIVARLLLDGGDGERKGEESTELLAQVFELAPDPVLILKDQRVLSVNRRCAEQLGGAPGDIEGNRIQEIIVTSGPYLAQPLNQHRTEFIRTNETMFPAEVSSAIVPLDGGDVSLLCIRNTSLHEAAESKLLAQWIEKEQAFREFHRHTVENREKIACLLTPHLDSLPEPQKLALQEWVCRVQSMNPMGSELWRIKGSAGDYPDDSQGELA